MGSGNCSEAPRPEDGAFRSRSKEKSALKIRLIDPAYEHPYISHSQKVIKNIWFARLTLTTLAALTPPDVQVKITDENVEDVWAFSSEAMMLLSRKGLLQAEEGNIWMAINPPDRNH